MSSKKKRLYGLLSLLLVMIIMIGATIALSKSNASKEQLEEETENITILSLEEEAILELDWQFDKKNLSFIKEKKGWKNVNDDNFPVDENSINIIISNITEVLATQLVVKDAEDLSQYGLEKPELTISVTVSDGTNQVIKIGDEVPSDTGGRYCRMNEEQTVYVIPTSIYSAFAKTEQELLVLEETPEITADAIQNLSIQYSDEDTFLLEKNKKREKQSDYNYWDIAGVYDKKMVADTTDVTAFFENYEGISYKNAVEYNCNNFDIYGLKNPSITITVEYQETYEKTENAVQEDTQKEDNTEKEIEEITVDKTYTLLIGDQTKEGDYYVRANESPYVYIMSNDIVKGLLGEGAFSLIYPYVCSYDIDQVSSIDLAWEQETHEMKRKINKTTTTNEEGEEEEIEEAIYYFDGAEIDKTTYINAYQQLASILFAKEAESSVEGEEVLSLILHTKKEDITIRFTTYDDNYNRVEIDGINQFLVDKRDVISLKNTILEIQQK